MKEKDILHERDKYWIFCERGIFFVMRCGITHSESDSAYLDERIAVARMNYLADKDLKR